MRFLIGFAALWLALTYTGGGLVGFAAVLVVYLVFARYLVAGGHSPFGRPTARAMIPAIAVAVLCQGVYLFTDARPKPGWVWLMIGTFAFHGLAEELVWRGYVYRHLRERRSFGRAVLASMPFVMAAHIPIVIESGWLVGGAALLVAAVTAIPLSYLYDLGRGTIWAPAVVHAGIDTFKTVDVTTPGLPLMLAAAAMVLPFLVFLPRPVRTASGATPGTPRSAPPEPAGPVRSPDRTDTPPSVPGRSRRPSPGPSPRSPGPAGDPG
jgi:membrane protease YdiL (CAAX protease family)